MFAKLALLAIAAVTMCSNVLGHATYYDVPAERPEAPQIMSWHVHLVYSLFPQDIEDALAIRKKAQEHFADYLGEECLAR